MTLPQKVPLFITRHSLSARSAIGVQTKRFAEANVDWLHFHWWSSEWRRQDKRSILLEYWVFSRYSIFKKGVVHKAIRRYLRLGPWDKSALRKDAARRLHQRYAGRITCAYVAPIDSDDAVRARSILEALRVPFVLHVWDFLDGDPGLEPYRWLVTNAAKVFCLSQPALTVLLPDRPDAQALLFSRDVSRFSAKPPENPAPLIILIMGDVGSYSDGLSLLDAALTLLDAEGVRTRSQYIGSARTFTKLNLSLTKRTEVLGFFEDSDGRDEALSRGHIAYLPGPFRDPASNLRSRYSIPSRVLDFMAVGLPVVGAVHPQSATAIFLKDLGLNNLAFNSTPGELAETLKQLSRCPHWKDQSDQSTAAFLKVSAEGAPAKLRRQMLSLR